MNKGILCGDCNAKFSPLDSLLESQLSFLNGAIGVRPDRAEGPKLVRGEAGGEPMAFDHTGTPVLPGPRTAREGQLPNGRRRVRTEFADERQVQQWLAEQKAAERDVRLLGRSEGRRFVLDPVVVTWSFGGVDAFREIGRIALNFLAHRWPYHARAAELRAFKDFVEGTRVPVANEPRFVWYAPADVPEIQSSPFAFGHQVLVVLESTRAYARVRFFSTFDLCVAFGDLTTTQPGAVLFDIDPLADRPPDDLRESTPADLPGWVAPPVADGVTSLKELASARLQGLLARVEERQWAARTEGLLDSINATKTLPECERVAAVRKLLGPHAGHVLHLARYVAGSFRRTLGSDDADIADIADILDSMVATDNLASDGLTSLSHAALELALSGLATAISSELDASPLTGERLRVWLSDAPGPGAHAVASVLIPILVRGMEASEK